MPRKKEKVDNVKEYKGNGNNKWSVVSAASPEDITVLLDDDWEPFAVDAGKIYFKKK